MKFDPEGFRTDFTVGIIELTEKGIVNVGKWNSEDGLLIERVIDEVVDDRPNSLKNKTFTMVIALVRVITSRGANSFFHSFFLNLL